METETNKIETKRDFEWYQSEILNLSEHYSNKEDSFTHVAQSRFNDESKDRVFEELLDEIEASTTLTSLEKNKLVELINPNLNS